MFSVFLSVSHSSTIVCSSAASQRNKFQTIVRARNKKYLFSHILNFKFSCYPSGWILFYCIPVSCNLSLFFLTPWTPSLPFQFYICVNSLMRWSVSTVIPNEAILLMWIQKKTKQHTFLHSPSSCSFCIDKSWFYKGGLPLFTDHTKMHMLNLEKLKRKNPAWTVCID